MRELQPELNRLKKKHDKDVLALREAQEELFKKYNVNPFSGCIPQIVQLVVLILLYRTLVAFLGHSDFNGVTVNPTFYWLNLTKPDQTFVLPLLAGLTQFILSLMILPGGETPDLVPNNAKDLATQEANEKEEDTAAMASLMQQQMIFVMPVMTAFFATKFPSGLAVYWITTTLFSIVQQYFVSGPGGLVAYWQRALAALNPRK